MAYIVGFFFIIVSFVYKHLNFMFYAEILLLKLLWIGLFQGYKASEEILKKDRFDSYIYY